MTRVVAVGAILFSVTLLCSLVASVGVCSNDLTGASLLNALSDMRIGTDTDMSFVFFAALVDVGLQSYCGDTLRNLGSASAQTLILVPDSAFERASIVMDKGLEEITSDRVLVCEILESSIVQAALNSRDVRDGDELSTASMRMPKLRVDVVQDINVRKLRIFTDVGTTIADLFATDVALCPRLSAVFASELLIPLVESNAFPSVWKISKSLPELSTSAEAFRITDSLRVIFESSEYDGYDGTVGRSSLQTCVFDGTNHGFRAYFLPSNRAWRRFFRKTELTKSALFSDYSLLLSILLYTEGQLTSTQQSIDLKSYLSTSLVPGQLLRPVGASTILSAFPGQVEIPALRVDVDISKVSSRYVRISGGSTSSRFDNTAVVVAADIVSCTGIVHIIDDVLVPPMLTAFRQLSLRSELSMFTDLLRAPAMHELMLELDTPSETNIFADSVVFAPTNVAIRLTLNYIGWTFEDLFQRDALLRQFVTYHVISTRSAEGAPERLKFRLGLGPEEQQFATRLAYPILAKSYANTFQGTPIAKTVKVLSTRRGVKKFFTPRHVLRGRLNSARFIKSDIPSTNGGIAIIDAALIPPTAEFGVTLYDRILRTPTLRVFRELTSVLGLQREFDTQGFGNGDCTVFAPTDSAWVTLLADLMTTQEEIANRATAMLYDIIMLMLAPRTEEFQEIERELYDPWLSKDALDGDELVTALSGYTTHANIIHFGAFERCVGQSCTPTSTLVAVPRVVGPVLAQSSFTSTTSWKNYARIISPDMASGQHALNGELYVIDTVLLPRLGERCRTADFTYNAGSAFELRDGRVRRYERCLAPPCSYTLPGLYGRAGVRISVEAFVTYDALPICDSWCVLISWWWCVPCTGVVAQTIATIGGCAPYQSQCGGSLVVFVTDAGEVRFGAQTFMDSYNNLPLSLGGGLRIVDVSVPGKGFFARDGIAFKVLCTYDGVSNTTKIYINDKLRGIADPFVMGQFLFRPFHNVSGNLHEKITIGNSMHSAASATNTLTDFQGMHETSNGTPDTRDGTLPAIGQFATYDASPLFDGSPTTQYFLPWRGTIHEVYVYFDNGLYQGIRYPSTCVHLEPVEPEADDFSDFVTRRRRLHETPVSRVRVGPRRRSDIRATS